MSSRRTAQLPDTSRMRPGGDDGRRNVSVRDLPPELLFAVIQAYKSGKWWELCEVVSKFCAGTSSTLCDDTVVWQQVSQLLPMNRRDGPKAGGSVVADVGY